MAHELVSTLLDWFHRLSPAFTKPSWRNALIVFLGWTQICGGHAVTGALVAAGVAGRRHHAAFHRFFSRSTWNTDAVGWQLFRSIVSLLPKDATIEIVVDDTLTKRGLVRLWTIALPNHQVIVFESQLERSRRRPRC